MPVRDWPDIRFVAEDEKVGVASPHAIV